MAIGPQQFEAARPAMPLWPVVAPSGRQLTRLRALLPPALADLLLDAVRLDWSGLRHNPFQVPAPGMLVLSSTALDLPMAALHLRHGLELAWLWAQAPAAPGLAALLAARTPASLLRLLPAAQREHAAADWWLNLLPAPGPVPQMPQRLWLGLRPLQPYVAEGLSTRQIELLNQLWPLAGAPEWLLGEGGDSRIQVDAETGRNAYVQSLPTPDMPVALGSCTASTLRPGGLLSAEHCRRRLLARALAGGAAAALRDEADAIREHIADYWQVSEEADVVLAPSGTDASLILSGIVATASGAASNLALVLTGKEETGRGVPEASHGRHFSQRTASGQIVAPGELTDAFPQLGPATWIALRTPRGRARSAAAIQAATEAAVFSRLAGDARRHVLLQLLDVSKTGLQSPPIAALEPLRQALGDRLWTAVDACQARFGPAQMQAYLRGGAAALVTGSKFHGGPALCGALLIPRSWLPRSLTPPALPAGLALYSSHSDWPAPVALDAPAGNVGLLLRWRAALTEMEAFAQLPTAYRHALIAGFAPIALAALRRDPRLAPLAVPRLHRPDAHGWDAQPTILTFVVRDAGGRPYGPRALQAVHRRLQDQTAEDYGLGRFQLGQPVELGWSGGRRLFGLRLALGASLLGGLSASGGDLRLAHAYQALRHELEAAVQKLSTLLDSLLEPYA